MNGVNIAKNTQENIQETPAAENTENTQENAAVVNEVTRKDLQQAAGQAMVSILKGGQSYKLGTRQLTRAALSEVRSLKDNLDAEEAAENGNGFLDNCYVACFDGR